MLIENTPLTSISLMLAVFPLLPPRRAFAQLLSSFFLTVAVKIFRPAAIPRHFHYSKEKSYIFFFFLLCDICGGGKVTHPRLFFFFFSRFKKTSRSYLKRLKEKTVTRLCVQTDTFHQRCQLFTLSVSGLTTCCQSTKCSC